jgi:hypothetical protein
MRWTAESISGRARGKRWLRTTKIIKDRMQQPGAACTAMRPRSFVCRYGFGPSRTSLSAKLVSSLVTPGSRESSF